MKGNSGIRAFSGAEAGPGLRSSGRKADSNRTAAQRRGRTAAQRRGRTAAQRRGREGE